jgi:hypothetical protein
MLILYHWPHVASSCYSTRKGVEEVQTLVSLLATAFYNTYFLALAAIPCAKKTADIYSIASSYMSRWYAQENSCFT